MSKLSAHPELMSVFIFQGQTHSTGLLQEGMECGHRNNIRYRLGIMDLDSEM